MELTEENAKAGDKAYLNLVLLQTLGTDHVNLIWCSIWSLIIQSYLLGFISCKIWKMLVFGRKRYSKFSLGGILVGFGVIMIQFGISINASYTITFQSSDYSTIAIDESKRTLSPLICCGILSGLSLGYAIWLMWKLHPKKIVNVPFMVGLVISLGLIIGISIITFQMPLASVSSLYLVKNWLRKQSILLRVWLGLDIILFVGIWIILIWKTKSNQEYEKYDKNMKIRKICQALCLPTLDLVILLIYSFVEVPSLANASKPLIQSLPPLFLLSLILLIQTFDDTSIEGGMKLPESSSSVYYKSPPISKRGLLPSYAYSLSDTLSGHTSSSKSGESSVKSASGSGGKKREGSFKVTVDTLISESKSVSSPPSAYTYGANNHNNRNRKSHSRHGSSPIPSPIPTPMYQNYSDVPLSIIAPFSEWLDQSSQPNQGFPLNHNDEHDGNREIDEDGKLSYKSAVPSGKTLLRTKSERSKKDRGIILDHTGWHGHEDLVSSLPLPAVKSIKDDRI